MKPGPLSWGTGKATMFVVLRLRGGLCWLYCVRRHGDKIFERAPGCAVRRVSHMGQFLVSGGACRPVVFFWSFPGRAVAHWCHAPLAVLGQFLVASRLRGRLCWLHCVRRIGQFLVFGRFSVAFVAPWPPRLRAVFVEGGGRTRGRLCGALVPSILCSGGVRSPGEVGVLGHSGFWCQPGTGLALSPGSQGVSRRALHSLRGPGPAP